MTQTAWRFEIPVDDKPHPCTMGTATPIRVDYARGLIDRVEFWVPVKLEEDKIQRWFQVTGTGHDAPDGWRYIGCAGRHPAGLVWHLWEVPQP